MGILSVLFHNSSQTSRTRQPVDNVVFPAGFRGALEHQTDQCVGCTTCQYVCSPGAIRFVGSERTGVTWEYQSSQCTFCGKCVEYCPTKALSFEQNAPVLVNVTSAIEHRVEYHACPDCGQLFAPLPVPTVSRLYGGYAPELMMKLMRLCEKCRNRAAVETWRSSHRGELRSAGGDK
jgi:ferredoxin